MNTQKITQSNLKKIWDVACNNWKTKIEEYSKRSSFGADVEVTQEEINEMFKAATTQNGVDQKSILSKYFSLPKESDYKIIKDAKIACEILGIKYRIPYDKCENHHEEATNAYYELTVIIAAVWKCKGVILETKNIRQSKYWPWLKQHPSGVGLSFDVDDYSCVSTDTISGVRLSSPDLETMRWVFNNFTHLYNKLDNQ